jgi:Pectate lyase superfamily protein
MCLYCVFFLLLPGLAQAGQINLNPCDQNNINNALSQVSQSGGGTVYLNPGTYELTGPIKIGSNTVLTGSPDAIIRVSLNSSQWFTNSVGCIGALDNVPHDIEIYGFQIDGNVENLPAGYANTPGHDHDCENLIRLQGDSNNFMNNIKVHDMKLYDSFGDGCHIVFCNHAEFYNNMISNTQHECFFFQSNTPPACCGDE